MEIKCDFGKLLNTSCNKDYYTRRVCVEKLINLSEETQDILLWRAGLKDTNNSREELTVCLHHKKVFGEVFERKIEKCCGILMKHRKKTKGKKT